MIDKKANGLKLKQLREELGMTLDEMSEKIGVARITMFKYETAERVPKDDTKLKISNVLGKNVIELFFTEQI